MNDFFSGFWGYYITAGTLGGIVFCAWLLFTMSKRRTTPGKKPELHGHVWDEDLREYNNPLPRWWMGLFIITVVFAGGYLLLYPGLGSMQGTLNWSSTGQHEAEVQAARTAMAPLYAKFTAMPAAELARDE